MSKHWNIDAARHTYAVPHWGDGYVDVDANGHIVMRPRGAGGPALSLPEIVEQLAAQIRGLIREHADEYEKELNRRSLDAD